MIQQPDTSTMQDTNDSPRFFFWLAGLSCFILTAYSLATILVVALLGGPPVSAEECFTMLSQNRFGGLLRLDLLTVFVMPLYYLLFYAIYLHLKKVSGAATALAAILVFAGLTLFLATPSVFSYLHLSDKFALATTQLEKSQLISAGEAILASDMWHGTGPRVGGILLQTGAVLISAAMLRSREFGKAAAYTGILSHGLDLAHILIGFALPTAGNFLMFIAGPLYLFWFPIVGLRLFRMSAMK